MNHRHIYFSLALTFSSIVAEDLQWEWQNGKLVQKPSNQLELQQTKQTDFDHMIEWKLVDGKLVSTTKIPKKEAQQETSKYILDIPDSEAKALQSVDFNRAKDITPSFEGSSLEVSPTSSQSRDLIQQQLSLEDQNIVLPERIAHKNTVITAQELNAWGQNLAQTKTWLEYHSKRLQADENPSRTFLLDYKRIRSEWEKDVADYKKIIDRAKAKQP